MSDDEINLTIAACMYLILIVALVALIYLPQWWVKHVLAKYSKPLEKMPGTGGELARHLLDRFELSHVKLETSDPGGDHYDPTDNTVRLSPDNIKGRSLTAVAVAAHEVGHAIQFNRKEAVSHLRTRYLPKAQKLQQIGAAMLMLLPVIAMLLKIPSLMVLQLLIGVGTMLLSVMVYVAILQEEWDASFNKALPILKEGGYVPEVYMPTVRKILTAAALTYVAAALASTLNLFRWIALLRGGR